MPAAQMNLPERVMPSEKTRALDLPAAQCAWA